LESSAGTLEDSSEYSSLCSCMMMVAGDIMSLKYNYQLQVYMLFSAINHLEF
jgi:hypothetical protein